jgi:hypothetical protein
LIDLGAVQSFWGPQQDLAFNDAGMTKLVDFMDVMPSRYGQLKFLAEEEEEGGAVFKTWKTGGLRIKGIQGFFYGTDSSLARKEPGFSTAQGQVTAASRLALSLNAEFLILGSPSSRALTPAVSELEIRSGYLELSQQSLDVGVPLLIENLPASFDDHGLSSVHSLLAFARGERRALGQIGFCLDLGNHFSHHPKDQSRAFSEARELLETGLVKHMQINLLAPNSLGWCIEFLRNVVDQNSLSLGLAIEVPDAGFEASLTILVEAMQVLRPVLSSTSGPRPAEFAD